MECRGQRGVLGEGVQILGTMDACPSPGLCEDLSSQGHPVCRTSWQTPSDQEDGVASGETEPTWVVLSFGDLGLSNITGEVHVLIGASLSPEHQGVQALNPGMGEGSAGQNMRLRDKRATVGVWTSPE